MGGVFPVARNVKLGRAFFLFFWSSTTIVAVNGSLGFSVSGGVKNSITIWSSTAPGFTETGMKMSARRSPMYAANR